MKSKLIFCVSLLMLVQAVASAQTITVPSRKYSTIQLAINAAHDGDTVQVLPGVYSGPNNINLDFHGAAITLISTVNPADPCWAIINATIIDCGGTGSINSSAAADTGKANRAFWFHTGEDNTSQVIGFTIRNGYARGPKGPDGGFLDSSVWQGFPYRVTEAAPWQTFPSWQQAVSSNPAIDPCTLPPAALDANIGSGNGYGGAILCTTRFSNDILLRD